MSRMDHQADRIRRTTTRRRPAPSHDATAGDPRPWPFRKMPRKRALRLATGALAVMALILVVMLTGITVARQDVGHVGVVRNGGPLDRRSIRQVLLPGQKLTWTGWFSQAPHQYPAAQVELLYTVTSDPARGARPGVDLVTVPTRDGVQVGLEATIFFHFVGDRDVELLKRFDNGLGTRRFETHDGRRLKPWEGDDGFSAFMDSVFRPVLENNLRREIGRFSCEQLVASCTLLRHASRPVAVGANVDDSSNVNIALVESRLTRSLEADLAGTLEAPYFSGMHFRLAAVRLPVGVQRVIDDVQARYASVSGARADVSRARYEDARNKILADTYQRSPALARIHAIRSAPKGATIIINDAGKSPGLNLGGG
jgi:regulator of protease activity HflC (stomatin/prohibitin superfamily)